MVHLYYLDQDDVQIDQIIVNNKQINPDPILHPEMCVKEETGVNIQSQIDFEVNKVNTNEETKTDDQNNEESFKSKLIKYEGVSIDCSDYPTLLIDPECFDSSCIPSILQQLSHLNSLYLRITFTDSSFLSCDLPKFEMQESQIEFKEISFKCEVEGEEDQITSICEQIVKGLKTTEVVVRNMHRNTVKAIVEKMQRIRFLRVEDGQADVQGVYCVSTYNATVKSDAELLLEQNL